MFLVFYIMLAFIKGALLEIIDKKIKVATNIIQKQTLIRGAKIICYGVMACLDY